MLYRINHDLRTMLWCGPAAIAAVTGQPTSIIHRLIAEHTGSARVQGVSYGALFATLRQLGYRCTSELHPRGMTLAEFARQHAADFAQVPMIVATTSHYVVLHGRRFVDNGQSDPVFIRDAPHRRARVECATAWVKVGEPTIPAVVLKPRNADLAKARRLAAKHGIDIEPERYQSGMCYWVTCPELADDDPCEGNQFCTDGAEVLAVVERYVECLTTGYLEAVTDPCLMPPPAGHGASATVY